FSPHDLVLLTPVSDPTDSRIHTLTRFGRSRVDRKLRLLVIEVSHHEESESCDSCGCARTGRAIDCRSSGVVRDTDRASAAAVRGERVSAIARPQSRLGGWVLVSVRSPLPLAQRLLDSTALSRCLLGGATLRQRPVFPRVLGGASP